MNILCRLKVRGKIVSINETQESIEIEIHGTNCPKERDWITKYLEDEGIMEEILAGNLKFAEPLKDTDLN
jgi:hypothetical protein